MLRKWYIRSMRKINWQKKVVLSIIGAIILIIAILFGVTYEFFVNRLKQNDEKIALLNFKQAEKNLQDLIGLSVQEGTRYYMEQEAWSFSKQNYAKTKRNVFLDRKIIKNFESLMEINNNLYSCVQLNGNGTFILSSERKSFTGVEILSEDAKRILEESQDSYPGYLWTEGDKLGIDENSDLYAAVSNPVLMGIYSFNKGISIEKNSYLLITISEDAICKCYESVIYNNSQAMLLNEEEEIISATAKKIIGTKFIADEKYQIVKYPLSYNNWTMVNMIPVKSYQYESRSIRNFGILIAAIASLLVIIVSLIWSKKYTKPIQILMDHMENVGQERFDMPKPRHVGWPELDNLNQTFYHTVQKLKSYMEKLKQTEQEKAQEEMRALQYQINPHFLYNSLNSIRWMAMMTNNTKVADALVMLSKIITPVFKNPSFTWKIKNELEFLDNYIWMMGLRFGETLDYKMNCPKELEEEIIPRFVLQPVLENCFVHGQTRQGIRHIIVKIEKPGDHFYIEIQNDTTKIQPEFLEKVNEKLLHMDMVQKEELGLYNVARRLYFLYGESSSVTLHAISETEIMVKIIF